jgi:hypothetical protein
MKHYRERKKRTVWHWILPIMIVGAFVLLLYFDNLYDEHMAEEATNDTALIKVKENNTAVNLYVDFISHNTDQMKLDHHYSSEALLRLLWATSAAADFAGVKLDDDAEKVRACANGITDNPIETTHADDIRKAADILSKNLQQIQEEKYPGLSNEADQVVNAAAQIDPDILALQQKDAINTFFLKSAQLLKKMN